MVKSQSVRGTRVRQGRERGEWGLSVVDAGCLRTDGEEGRGGSSQMVLAEQHVGVQGDHLRGHGLVETLQFRRLRGQHSRGQELIVFHQRGVVLLVQEAGRLLGGLDVQREPLLLGQIRVLGSDLRLGRRRVLLNSVHVSAGRFMGCAKFLFQVFAEVCFLLRERLDDMHRGHLVQVDREDCLMGQAVIV